MLVASLVFIPLIVVPWIVTVPRDVERYLTLGDWAIWLLFLGEYLALLYLAPDRWRVVRTHVFDLIIIAVPFARPLRKVRALRLLRLGAVAARTAQLVKQLTARAGFKYFLGFVSLIMALGGLLVYALERTGSDPTITSWQDGLWWALVTTTTVGYGDEYPTTPEGRIIAAGLMLLGISLISVVTARIAAFFVATDDDGLDEISLRLDRIERLLDVEDGAEDDEGSEPRLHSPNQIEERYERLTPRQRRDLDEILDNMLEERRHAERQAERRAERQAERRAERQAERDARQAERATGAPDADGADARRQLTPSVPTDDGPGTTGGA